MTLPRRLLLGASLSTLAAPMLPASAPAQTAAQRATNTTAALNALSARANAWTVGVISGGLDGTYARIAADLAAVLDDGDALRVLPILGRGSLQNISDILALRGVDVGIVQSDVLAYARRERLLPGLDGLIQYITKLYDEEVHVVGGVGVTRIADLAGKPVNVDGRGSGTAMTASLLFEAMGLKVEMRHDPQDTALEKLKRGEIAALVYVAGKPTRLFAGIPREAGLTLLPVPATPALLETYLPARFSGTDYPGLVPEGGTVETVAVGAVMAVYAWPAGIERHRKVARFVEAFATKFPAFLQPPRHPKWREVNLAAQVPGWSRFSTVEPVTEPRRRVAAQQ